MDKRIVTLNVVFAIVDTLISGMAIAAFGWGAYHFDRWWILLFTAFPLIEFNSHTLVTESVLRGGNRDVGGGN